MTHDFHRYARCGACAGKIGGQRVTQGMEVGPVSLGVYKFDTCRRQVGFETLHGGHHSGKDPRFACGQFGNVRAHFSYKVGMEGDDGLLVVLGRGGANINERLLAFQMKIVLLQRGHFTAAQAGVNGGKINNLTLSRDGKKAPHFLIRERAAGAHLPAVALHLLDVLKRITRDSLMLFHPVEERRN